MTFNTVLHLLKFPTSHEKLFQLQSLGTLATSKDKNKMDVQRASAKQEVHQARQQRRHSALGFRKCDFEGVPAAH